MHLHLDAQNTAEGEAASDEEDETDKNDSSPAIKAYLSMRKKVKGFVKKNHPSKSVSSNIGNFS